MCFSFRFCLPFRFQYLSTREEGERREAMSQRFEQNGGNMCSSGDTAFDRISTLPDHLLNSILSRLTLKEHIATSILSHRWRYLWTLTTRLDFDGLDSLMRIEKSFDRRGLDETYLAYEKLRLNFFSWVDHVLASRKESDIEEFKVCFDLNNRDEEHINKWLIYALACKVQRLELNLQTTRMRPIVLYAIPDTLFSHVNEEVCSSPYPIHFKQLRTISLNGVGVDCKALEFFLQNCPLLGDLSVRKSSTPLTLRVVGPFPSLKRLEISHCYTLGSIEIRDVNLVSFKYVGRKKPFVLQKVLMLAHLSVSLSLVGYMKLNIAQFSSIFKQLEIFTVDVQTFKTPFLLPVEMNNLKQLEVVVTSVEEDDNLLWLATLIQSAPRLQKFVLESHCLLPNFCKREFQRMENSYPHLKEVEFVGFCGSPTDLEFVFHFVENAAALKRIVVDTKNPFECLAIRLSRPNYNSFYKFARRRLEEKLALENPAIKLEFLIHPFLCFNNEDEA